MVSACSVSSPLVIDATDNGRIATRSVALAIADEDTDTRRGLFGNALRGAFAALDFAIQPDGKLVADYAIAEGPAADGVMSAAPEAGQTPQWLSQPRVKKRFDQCKPRRLRATLVMFDRTSGAIAYRGSAARIECAFAPADVTAMADALVNDAVTRLLD